MAVGWSGKPVIFELVFERKLPSLLQFLLPEVSFLFFFTLTLAHDSIPALEQMGVRNLRARPPVPRFSPRAKTSYAIMPPPPTPWDLSPAAMKSSHQLIVEKYWEIQILGCFRTFELSETAVLLKKLI